MMEEVQGVALYILSANLQKFQIKEYEHGIPNHSVHFFWSEYYTLIHNILLFSVGMHHSAVENNVTSVSVCKISV